MSRTTGSTFVRAYHKAVVRVDADKFPNCFRATALYVDARRLGKQYKLPHNQLLKLALALHYALIGAPPVKGREVKVAFAGARSSLRRARAHLEVLEDVDALPGASSAEHLPDGSIEITFESTPIEVFRDQMDQFSEQLRHAQVKTRGRSGQRVGYLTYAVRLLVGLIEDRNPSLPLKHREKLCESLFDEVRERANAGELPGGYRTLLKRVAAVRRERVGSQSTKN